MYPEKFDLMSENCELHLRLAFREEPMGERYYSVWFRGNSGDGIAHELWEEVLIDIREKSVSYSLFDFRWLLSFPFLERPP